MTVPPYSFLHYDKSQKLGVDDLVSTRHRRSLMEHTPPCCHVAYCIFCFWQLYFSYTLTPVLSDIYNALTIHGLAVCDTLPSSVLDISNFWRQTAYSIGGYVLSLDDIEHGILRGKKGCE